MSALVLTDACLWLGQYSFQGLLSNLALNLKADDLDSTIFNNSGARTHQIGLRGFGFQGNGFWDSALDLGLYALNSGAIITATPISTVGATAYVGMATQTDYTMGGAVGAVLPFTVGGQGTKNSTTVGIVRGQLFQNGALAATTPSANAQLGALSAGQNMVCNLHVSAASGTLPTLDVTIESATSGGFGSPTTRGTISQITTAAWAQVIIPGAVTDQFWRFKFTIGGTLPSFTIGAAMGLL